MWLLRTSGYLCVQPVSHHTLCPSLFLAYSFVLISLFLALYLSVVLPLPLSLPQSRTLLGAVAALSLFLSHCFETPFSFSRSLSHSLTGPLTLFFPPIPPSFYLFLSLPRDCDGSQCPAQMCVISDSICTDSDLGLMFVVTLWYNMRFPQGSTFVTLWYNMRFPQGSASFSLAFFQSESPCWLCACVSLSLQLLVVWSIVYW